MTDSDTLNTETADSIEAFAADLRALRRAAGDPTLHALSSRTGVSKSVIADAFVGKKLPTERTVVAIVQAIGGNEQELLARRTALDPRRASAPLPDPTTEEAHPGRGGRSVSLRATVLIACAAAIVSTSITSAVWFALAGAPGTGDTDGEAGQSQQADYLPYADGVDPMRTVCREDAVIAASEQRLDDQFQVQMMYSNKCMAVWGRVTRYDGKSSGNLISMKIYPAIDHESSRNQERSAYDIQSIYTTLMIEPDVEARVCGIATITTDGTTPVELGPQMCI